MSRHGGHHVHHKEELSGKKKKKKAALAAASFLLAFFLVGAVALALDGRLSLLGILNDRFEDEDEEYTSNEITLHDETYLIRDRFDTLLFMGTDHSGNEEESGKDYQGSMADFLVLMVIDHTQDTYAFLPIDRNTITDVHLIEQDGSGEAVAEEQICTAHWYGGDKKMSCENTVTAVSEYLGGLPISGYYAIGMSEIPKINHELGGVTVTLKDDFSASDPKMKPGTTLTLTDRQAEIFLHSRMNMSDDTNRNRMARQKVYMAEAIKKIKAKLKERPKYYEELSAAFSEAATSSITGKQTSRAANALAKYKDLGVFEIQGESKLGTVLEDGEEHEEFYPDEDSELDVMTSLYHLEKEEE